MMGLFARLLGRKPYPNSPLLEQAMRVPEPAPEPKGVWVAPADEPLDAPSGFVTHPTVGFPATNGHIQQASEFIVQLPASEFLRRVAHPDKRDRLIEWMEAAANGTVQRDGRGRFVKRKSGGAL